MRTRSVGRGVVEGSSSRQARKQGVIRPCGAASRSQFEGGVEDVLGDRGHQRCGRGIRIFAAKQIHRALAWRSGWQCRLPDGLVKARNGPGSPVEKTTTSPAERWSPCCRRCLPSHATHRIASPSQNLAACGCLLQNLGWLLSGDRVRHPLQHMLQRCDRLRRPRGGSPAAPWPSRRHRTSRRCPDVRSLTAPVTVPAANALALFSAIFGSTQPAIGSHTNSGRPGAAPNGSRTAIGRVLSPPGVSGRCRQLSSEQ